MVITVTAHPNSKRPRIETDLLGMLHVYVSAPPLDGRANEAVIKALAEHFHVAKSTIKLVKGHTSKLKTLEIPS